jgi:hypothetical protein
MNIAVATYPRLYVRPMEKHELELVTNTCTMSCNVLLQDCTRHIAYREGRVARVYTATPSVKNVKKSIPPDLIYYHMLTRMVVLRHTHVIFSLYSICKGRAMHFVRRTTYVPFRLFWGDGGREFMKRLSVLFMVLWVPFSAMLFKRAMPTLWHVFTFLGLRFVPLFLFLLSALYCFFL